GVVIHSFGEGPGSTLIGMGPTFSSTMNRVASLGTVPSSRKTYALPTVGWPAKSISLPGVKMRSLAAQSGRVGGSRNTVSDKFSSSAIFCISSALRFLALGNTASGFPSSGWLVNTSTTRYRYDLSGFISASDGLEYTSSLSQLSI